MSEPITITTKDGLHLRLTRVAPEGPPKRKAVLLLHGASANHGTFEIHNGGLAKWLADLAEREFDPWLLDWRGSSLVVDDEKNRSRPAESFNFNAAATFDIRAALDRMAGDVEWPIAMVGHCMGSGVLAEAIAQEHVTHERVDCIVLLTLGLFYETPLDSRMKSEERILDRLRAGEGPHKAFPSVDPRVHDATGKLKAKWPDDLDQMYEEWPGRMFHSAAESPQHGGHSEACRIAGHMCNRLSFMYGMPYYHGNLVDEIHGTAALDPLLAEQFGSIPLHMYLHAAQNIRLRHAMRYDDSKFDNASFISDAARKKFSKLKRVTLITGDRNRLWHRNSIDYMYEWLTQGRLRNEYVVEKHILPDYGHQDLLWGKEAPKCVYPIIKRGLRPKPDPDPGAPHGSGSHPTASPASTPQPLPVGNFGKQP